MKPFLVLLSVFLLSLVVSKVQGKNLNFSLSARIAMSAMMLFSAMGHFAFPKGMAMMLPAFIPLKTEIIYLSGLMEIFFAIGLLLPKFQTATAWLIIAFLVLSLPANIYAASIHLDYQEASYHGPGLSYLWLRIPLQLFFMAWTYLSAIR